MQHHHAKSFVPAGLPLQQQMVLALLPIKVEQPLPLLLPLPLASRARCCLPLLQRVCARAPRRAGGAPPAQPLPSPGEPSQLPTPLQPARVFFARAQPPGPRLGLPQGRAPALLPGQPPAPPLARGPQARCLTLPCQPMEVLVASMHSHPCHQQNPDRRRIPTMWSPPQTQIPTSSHPSRRLLASSLSGHPTRLPIVCQCLQNVAPTSSRNSPPL
mmetsp:Transcript_84770/g.162188  ORF Transcript_84770/g.162188 Transcript_84770/m.162188 type:complete len:215 (+) Transcript_84770:1316-1960(+)